MATTAGSKETPRRRPWWRRVVVGLAILAGAVVAFTTVSTDDAYVNGHATYVAPRIGETVERVLVDDTAVVRKGDLLVVLDDAMWKIRAAQAGAALEVARKGLDQAIAGARAQVAAAKASRYKLAAAITQVKDQVAALRGAVARLEAARAAEGLAKAEADRYTEAARAGSVTKEQADIRRTDLEQARARTRAALEDVHRIRVALELPEEPPAGRPLDDVPRGQDQRHSSVLAALGSLALELARLGVALPGYYETPDEFVAKVKDKAPGGDIDALIDRTVAAAPAVATARAQVDQAEQDLAQARLNLSYCRVVADVDGVVSNRNVNPGDIVAQG
ncbi:MAG TPA: hypothetical protein VG406_19160 [Isosphaeraceae bacterium]|jgi:membrane fusion protein (multidrug efflux system)|nr:hypothetical protein [Isosphaeraceae bacterium]